MATLGVVDPNPVTVGEQITIEVVTDVGIAIFVDLGIWAQSFTMSLAEPLLYLSVILCESLLP
jgi:hypothetical protein